MSPHSSAHTTALDPFYASLINENAASLVDHFYHVLLGDREARTFLDNTAVEEQLKPALITWLSEVCAPTADADEAEFEARQEFIGQVHARINVPLHLVNEGASTLQSRISALIRDCDRTWESRYDAMCSVYQRIDRAISIMARSYVHGVEDHARLEEAYRLFSLDQDLNLERERQRASLMEWSQSILFGILQSDNGSVLKPLSGTSFGVWVRHRAGVLFGDSAQLAALGLAIVRVDTQLLPLLESDAPGVRDEALRTMRQTVEQMGAALSGLFQGLTDMESGRDTLTRTMNRRFLPSILAREINFAVKNSTGLAVMIFDIDHFKQINDSHGHQAGDSVLRQVADTVAETLRSTDFLFRYGGEEFLVLFVEIAPDQGIDAAEQVRQAIEGQRFSVGNTEVPVTISVGVALYDGHPDPDHFLKRADDALRRAKHGGRNRVVLSA
ncbi:GGDEF domain-containing protein [Mycobacterium sp. MS1601]|uniref:GGDEF domain-containing protein n=1 Tax=Mycobacterium sp. MS1601 TaxID=1936029 RepID=UPI00178CC62A|nr:GGDEF domain-containing protein [Mycobacterium sp. MS1601]